MSVIYTLIAKDNKTVLADFHSVQGNFPIITQKVLGRIRRNTQMSYNYNP